MLVYTPEEEEVFFDQIDKVYSLAEAGSTTEAEAILLQLAADVPLPREDNTLGAILLESIYAFYEQKGDTGMALPHYLAETDFLQEKMKTEAVKNPVHFVTTGSILVDLNELDRARRYFKIALKLAKNKIFNDFNPDFLHMALISDEEFDEFKLTYTPQDDSDGEALNEDIMQELETLVARGNEILEEGDFDGAITVFQKAILLLPDPAETWEVYPWIAAPLADAYFGKEEYTLALPYFQIANDLIQEEEPDAFLKMRLGQTLLETGNKEDALIHLNGAYEMGGEEVFEGEDRKYLEHLKVKNT